MVVALLLLGGKQDTHQAQEHTANTGQGATPVVSRIIREPSLLYMAGEHRVSFLAALEYRSANEIAPAGAFVPEDATEEPVATESTAEPMAPTASPTRVQPAPLPTKAPAAPSPAAASGPVIQGQATAYGPAYNGQVLGCGTGYYDSNDTTILAVSPARYAQWPCGTQVQICGPAGCIIATRQDACPGCYANLVDLSEAGNAAVCGSPPHTCKVTLQVVSMP